ncbi:MAG: NAD(+) diphosphatase [Alloprevotella sp.]
MPQEIYWLAIGPEGLLLENGISLPCSPNLPAPLLSTSRLMNLPALDGKACKAYRPTDDYDHSRFKAIDLRASFDILPRPHYDMAGKAAELLYWDDNTHFCGRCGTVLEPHTDISKRCPHCGKEVWPLLATAIIVAVTRGKDDEEILLVQSKNFRGDYLGLVAGFVETGETLEDCVKREVKEETGLDICDLRYFASQPWPYPCGLMVGFKARYAGGTITLQRSELNKGGWYRRDNLPAIPGPVSLARRLIEDWKNKA